MNPTRRDLSILSYRIVAGLVALGCRPERERAPRARADLERPRNERETRPVFVGAFASLSGPERAYGESLRRGFELALDEVRASGGIRGCELVLHTFDDQGLDGGARAIGQRLAIEEHLVALVGGSRRSLSIAAAAEVSDVLFVAALGSDADLERLGKHSIGLAPSTAVQARALAKHARETLAVATAAVVFASDDVDARESADAFERELGSPLAARVASVDLERSIDALRAAGADVTLVAARGAELARLAARVREATPRSRILCGLDLDARGARTSDLEGAHFVTALAIAPDHEIARAHEQRFGFAIDGCAALGRDAVMRLATALRACETFEEDEVLAALRGGRLAASASGLSIAEVRGGECVLFERRTRN